MRWMSVNFGHLACSAALDVLRDVVFLVGPPIVLL